ncbi:MAG: hypothetical protein JRI36_01000, partial [Deltaproteobacteria bacterium]|nr:hypothetical protein [Deltaproteobacteria bacterium]
MDHKTTASLSPVVQLFRRSWQVYREHMATLMATCVAAMLVPVVALVPVAAAGYLMWRWVPGAQLIALGAGVILAVVVALWAGNWGAAAFLTAVSEPSCGFKEAFKRAKPLVLAHIWLGALTGLIIAGGYMLFVIPGIVFSVWF